MELHNNERLPVMVEEMLEAYPNLKALISLLVAV